MTDREYTLRLQAWIDYKAGRTPERFGSDGNVTWTARDVEAYTEFWIEAMEQDEA